MSNPHGSVVFPIVAAVLVAAAGLAPGGAHAAEALSQPAPVAAVQVGHGATVKALAFSPDGKSLLSGSLDKTAIIWDVATGRARAVLRGHHDWVTAVAFSPDGKTVATGSFDGVTLWNAVSGAKIGILEPFAGVIQAMAWSPDGHTIVCGRDGATPELWNPDTRQAIKALDGPKAGIRAYAFAPDGHTLAVGQADGAIRVWNVATGAVTAELTGHTGVVHGVTFNRDGSLLASASDDGTVRLWDVATRATRSTLKAGDRPVWGAVFVGSTVVTVGEDTIPHRWSAVTGEPLTPLGWWDREPMQAAAVSPDGATLATGGGMTGRPGVVRLWDMKTRTVQATMHGKTDVVTCADFSFDGSVLATGAGRDLKLWDTRTWKLRFALPGDSSWIQTLAFSNDGKTVAGAGWGGTVPLYDVQAGAVKGKLQGLKGTSTIAFSPDNSLIAAVGDDQEVRLFDSQGAYLRSIRTPAGPVQLIAFSADNKRVAISSKALHQAWIADVQTDAIVTTIDAPPYSMLSIALSPDGQTAATGAWDKNVKLWDAATGKLKGTLPLMGGVRAIAFSPDGKRLAASDVAGTVSLYDMTTPTPMSLADAKPGPEFPASLTRPLLLAGGGIALLSQKGGLAALLLPMPRADGAEGPVRQSEEDAAKNRNASWLVTTPDGYFDCSPDAIGQILWNVGGELLQEADFDARFHRPDLVEKAMQDAW